jgi:hypothetical protein
MPGKPASRVRGLSGAQFREAHGTEERCRAVVGKPRRPAGFVRPSRGGTGGTRPSARPKVRCRARRHRTPPTAGTTSHATGPPLAAWFLAMRPVASAEDGIGPVGPGRRLGIGRTNARALEREVVAVTAGREDRKRPGRDGRRPPGRPPPGRARRASGRPWPRSRPVPTAARARSSSRRSRAPAGGGWGSSSPSPRPRPAGRSRTGRAAGPRRPRPAWSTGR